jgi:hypothetical protein
MSVFQDYFVEMMKNPPDRDEPQPISNRRATMYGATLPFHILAWIAVLVRLWTRFRIVRDTWWDDYIILVCSVFNLISMVGFIGGRPPPTSTTSQGLMGAPAIYTGLGEHILFVGEGRIITLMKYIYLNQAAYYMCAGLVKISLLCQYLRMFRSGALRKLCLGLLVFTSIWTVYWNMQGWLPCFPVSGYWNRQQTPAPKCTYLFGLSATLYDTLLTGP